VPAGNCGISLLGKVAHATISSGSRHSNSYACKRGAWCGGRHLRMTSASAVGQFGLARNRCRTQFHPRRHRTIPSGQPVLSSATVCASEVLPLYVHQPLAGNNLLDFVREVRRPWQLESHLATRNKLHLIIATELRRYFTDAGRGLPSEFMRSLLSDHSWYVNLQPLSNFGSLAETTRE
jgi:hypothetical protein